MPLPSGLKPPLPVGPIPKVGLLIPVLVPVPVPVPMPVPVLVPVPIPGFVVVPGAFGVVVPPVLLVEVKKNNMRGQCRTPSIH